VLVQRNCPFRQIAREDPDALCEGLDEEIQRIALPGAEVDLDCSMAKGDRQCRHAIREAD
jgi:predicted ArsR family transcriptional regulator